MPYGIINRHGQIIKKINNHFEATVTETIEIPKHKE